MYSELRMKFEELNSSWPSLDRKQELSRTPQSSKDCTTLRMGRRSRTGHLLCWTEGQHQRPASPEGEATKQPSGVDVNSCED